MKIQIADDGRVLSSYSNEYAESLDTRFIQELIDAPDVLPDTVTTIIGEEAVLYFNDGKFNWRVIKRPLTWQEQLNEMKILLADIVGGAL